MRGFVKGAMNFVAGRLSETAGRRKVLLWGWVAAMPIPFMILYAPSWNWIVAANVLLGVNQGFAWSMTVTSKLDITRPEERGLATGFNEFAGYSGVAIAGIVTGYLATSFDPRWSLFSFGLVVALMAFMTAYVYSKETLPWARAEANSHRGGTYEGPTPRFPINVSEHPSTAEIFALVSFRHRTFSALSQAGCVEKFVDALLRRSAGTIQKMHLATSRRQDPFACLRTRCGRCQTNRRRRRLGRSARGADRRRDLSDVHPGDSLHA